MPHTITGLKYQSPFRELKTEEQLLNIFSELKDKFEILKKGFRITNESNTPITDFSQFLQVAIGKKAVVTLEGSGDIGGIVIQEGRLEYDLSEIAKLTKYWDINRNDGSCNISCEHYYPEYYTDNEWNPKCEKHHEVGHPKFCVDYSPFIKNAQGKPASTLQELISAACA